MRGIVPRSLTFCFPSIVSGPKDDLAVFLNHNRLHCTEQTSTDLTDLQIPPTIDACKLEELLIEVSLYCADYYGLSNVVLKLSLFMQQIKFKPKSNKWITSNESINSTAEACSYFANAVSQCIPSAVDIKTHYLVALEFISTKFFNISTELKGESSSISLTDENRTVNATAILSALGE